MGPGKEIPVTYIYYIHQVSTWQWYLLRLEHDSVEAFLTWLRDSQHAAPPMVFGTIWGYEEVKMGKRRDGEDHIKTCNSSSPPKGGL